MLAPFQEEADIATRAYNSANSRLNQLNRQLEKIRVNIVMKNLFDKKLIIVSKYSNEYKGVAIEE